MIEILNTGMYTSVQDIGRHEFQSIGVPISGAMDQTAFSWANLILNNPIHSAVLEMCFKGPKIRFHKESCIAITGALMNPKLNGEAIGMYKPIKIKEGDILAFGNATQGCRTYLAVTGGIQTPEVLGSKSQFKGITSSERIVKRSLLPINSSSFDFHK
ncbi:MAG: allophanate hydrolase subunit 2 family protein, partial [Flavobacteriaceae bacterium]